MSRRSSAQYYHRDYVGDSADARLHHAGHGDAGHGAGRGAGRQAALGRWAGYTLIHAGRQLRLGPIAFWVVVGTLVIMAVWTITTATYFAFRDDVLTRLIARQAEMQFGYEDRIAELRAQVDRMSSRQLLDQEQFEHKLDQILRRQTMLEQRANTLSTLPDLSITGSIRPAGRAERPALGKPAPINDRSAPPAPGRKAAIGNVEGALTRLAAALDRVETEQSTAL